MTLPRLFLNLAAIAVIFAAVLVGMAWLERMV